MRKQAQFAASSIENDNKGEDFESSVLDENNLTMNDIAQQLNISKTTVSRASSGKGRVMPRTRQRVRDYVSQHGYRPSASTARLLKAKPETSE